MNGRNRKRHQRGNNSDTEPHRKNYNDTKEKAQARRQRLELFKNNKNIQEHSKRLNKSTINTTANNKSTINIDLIVKTQGEFGNHIHGIALGQTIKYMSKEFNYPFHFKIHYLGQKSSSLLRTKKMVPSELASCFPSLSNIDFRECNVNSYDKLYSHQEYFYGKNNASTFNVRDSVTTGSSIQNLHSVFQYIQKVTKEERNIAFHQLQSILNDVDILPLNIPFVLANNFCHMDLVDRYRDEIREYFSMNSSSCCSIVPEEDETVVHIRGFATEMKRHKKIAPKYSEVNATILANNVLSHLKEGDKVALLSRFAETLYPYQHALEERNITVRTITGQSVVEDFCFLMSTTKELVGMISSTYVYWASLLSYSVKNVTLYRTSAFEKVENKHMPYYPYFNDPILNATFNFPII